MFVSGVCKSVRTNTFVADRGIVAESVVELVVETEFGPSSYYINGATATVGCEVSVKCCWVQLSEGSGYWSANPLDMLIFSNEVDWSGECDVIDMEVFDEAPF